MQKKLKPAPKGRDAHWRTLADRPSGKHDPRPRKQRTRADQRRSAIRQQEY